MVEKKIPAVSGKVRVVANETGIYRVQIVTKMTDDEIRKFLRERYGDFVLYDPPFNKRTWLIWSMPLIFLVLGIWWVFSTKTRSALETRIELSQSDRDQLKEILDDNRQ